MKNILITGERWSSSARELLVEIKNMLNCDIGGYWVNVTRDIENKNMRIFDLTSLYEEDRENVFFKKDDLTGISKLNIDVFNTKGVEMIQKSFKNREVFVLNEIGFLESKAYRFTKEINNLLDSPKIVIALVKGVSCPYIDSILSRKDIKLFNINEKNKNEAKHKILELLREWKVQLVI